MENLIDLLTLERARAYAIATMIVGCFLVFHNFASAPEEISGGIDFPAFYNAGRILNEYPRGDLYDQELQHRLYLEVAPSAGDERLFAYTPFFALFFSPLALLPFFWALVCWMVISLILFTAGFWLAWSATDLPIEYRHSGFLIAVSFLPFFAWCVLAGQSSAFGFFSLALAIYLDRKNPFLSGWELALLLYKPPLLILLVPMLVVTKRWRTLAGFGATAAVLVLISIVVIGLSGIHSYVEMLRSFSHTKSAGVTRVDIDLFSFFLLLFGPVAAKWFVAVIAVIVIPSLVVVWTKEPMYAWALAITWTLILNFYVLIYDSTLIILPVLLVASTLWRPGLPRAFRWLLLLLFLVAWPEAIVAQKFGFQLLTVVVVAFGIYQIVVSRYEPVLTTP